MDTWSALLLAFALSLDGFAVGVAYGMRKVHLPWRSLEILGLCTAAGFSVSMLLGELVASLPGFKAPHVIGGAILVVLGLWQLIQGWLEYRANGHGGHASLGTLLRVRIKSLGIVIQILQEPTAADMDRSGAIDGREAIVLGTALGLDALAAGFAAAMVGFGFSVIGLVTGGLLLLTWAGLQVGKQYGARWVGEKGFFVPGTLLILLGVLQF